MKKQFKPRPKQRKAIKAMIENPAYGLLADPGFGKTVSVLSATDILKSEGIINKLLIVSTKRIINSVWPREIIKWGFNFKVSIVDGKHRADALKAKADIYLIHFDNLTWLQTQPKALREQFDMLVIDESTKVKNHKTLRFKTLKGDAKLKFSNLLNSFSRRYILTGTPTPKSMEDLFAQIYVLDQGEALGKFITHFRNRYFHPSGNPKFFKYELNEGAEKEVYKAIKHLAMRIEYQPNVKKINNYIEIDMPDNVAKYYRDMENDLFLDIKKNKILAANAGVATSKLRQIVNGHIRDNDKKVHYLHEAKIEALSDIIDELQGNPLLVGYEFEPDLTMLMKAFPSLKIGNKVIKTRTMKDNKKAVETERDWNAGKIPLLFGQISAIAHGLNLQEVGHHVCFYSMTWNLEDYEQLYRRLWREGQKNTVYVHHLMMGKSIDYDVKASLERKSKTQSALLKAFKTRLSR